MPDDIQARLKKLPPFEEDIPMIAEVKEISKQQTSAPQIQEPKEEEKPEEVVEEKEEVEEVKEEPKSERTAEQFEKLKEHNKELKEENQEVYKNVLESLKPEAPIIPQKVQEFTPQVQQEVEKVTEVVGREKVDDIFADLIDKDGYIDPDLLKKTLQEALFSSRQARIEAENAKKEAQTAREETKRTKRDFEESREVREVHKKYPQIDPKNEEFNEMFWDDVRKEIATAPILKGETPSFMEAADKIWNDRYAKEVEVNKKDKEKLAETEDAKKQINATAPSGRPGNYYAKSEDEALKQAVLQGKKGALAERLRRAGQ